MMSRSSPSSWAMCRSVGKKKPGPISVGEIGPGIWLSRDRYVLIGGALPLGGSHPWPLFSTRPQFRATLAVSLERPIPDYGRD